MTHTHTDGPYPGAVFLDFETHVGPLHEPQKPVCLTAASGDKEPTTIVGLEAIERALRAALDSRRHLVWHYAPFDFWVAFEAFPNLRADLLESLADGLWLCTKTNQELIDISTNRKHFRKSLGMLVKHYGVEVELDKTEDSVRMRYAEVEDVPVDQWPKAFRKYAANDVIALREVFRAQMKYETPTLVSETRSDICVKLMQNRGIATDLDFVDGLKAKFKKQFAPLKGALLAQGLLKYGSDSDVGKPVEDVKLTKCVDKVEALVEKTLGVKSSAAEYTKQITELSFYRQYVKTETQAGFLNPFEDRPDVIRAQWGNLGTVSGRMACRNPNMQNRPPGDIRNCFVPRPGFVFVKADYSSHEFRCLGQILFDLFGDDVITSKYNEDRDFDSHTHTGNALGVDRKTGKTLNFAFAGGFTENTLAATEDMSVELAYNYLQGWIQTWHMQQYFDWCSASGGILTVPQTGFVRAGVKGMERRNGPFQGLGATILKEGLGLITVDTFNPDSPLYEGGVVLAIHDEIVVEVKTEKAEAGLSRIVDLMVKGHEVWTPDCLGQAKGVIYRERWQ